MIGTNSVAFSREKKKLETFPWNDSVLIDKNLMHFQIEGILVIMYLIYNSKETNGQQKLLFVWVTQSLYFI